MGEIALSWYKVEFSAGDVLKGLHRYLQEDFETRFMITAAPRDAGMFMDKDDPTINVYYFSPGAAKIALPLITQYGGVQCDAPSKSGVSLCAGNSGAEDIPFGR